MSQERPARPWAWVPSLYYGQGLPFVVVMTLAVVLYKKLGLSNTEIALYTSWLYLPWVIKPLWSPLVELFGRKRQWILALQFTVGTLLAAVALTLPMPQVLQLSLALFWLLAFASATHDIAADGFYMLALREDQQAAFVGVRSLFYRLAMISGQGGLIYLAGHLETALQGSVIAAWTIVFAGLALLILLLASWHTFILPRPGLDQPPQTRRSGRELGREFLAIIGAFFRRRDIMIVLGFLLTYRLAEAQIVKLLPPFLLDPRAQGGLALTTQELGLIYGGFGVAALIAGGLLGGWTISKIGLMRALGPMLAAIHLPNLLYVALAFSQPESRVLIGAAIVLEQFGYGFGFAAYLMFMIWAAEGPTRTAHYALCTGFMALGMMLPGMASGWIQSQLGYPGFFIWVSLCALPSLAIWRWLAIPPTFGRKSETT